MKQENKEELQIKKEDAENEFSKFLQSFAAIQSYAHANARAKGFYDHLSQLRDIAINEDDSFTLEMFGNVMNDWKLKALGLMCEEIGEAMSAVRENKYDDKLTSRLGVEVELADVIIRIMDFAGAINLDVAGALVEKMEYNNSRPYKHGKTN